MSLYTLVPQLDEKTRDVVCYMFRVNDDPNVPRDTVLKGQMFLYAGRDFLKIRNAEDAITVLNYLNETAKNER